MTAGGPDDPRDTLVDDTAVAEPRPLHTVTDTGGGDGTAATVDGWGRAAPDDAHDLIGKTIGRYRVEARLGAGGMGVVWAAFDPALDRKVALKVLPPLAADRRAHLEIRLRREAQALARLEHAHVIAVYDVGVAADSVFVAMQLIDGATLDGYLAQERPEPARILALFVEAARGLAAAHAAGIVHRDVKPSNLLVDRAGRVYVGDFGLARSAEDDDDGGGRDTSLLGAEMTRAGAVMGTPVYMAPEQHAGAPATARSDQFSLCVSLWEALFGQHPFVDGRWTEDAALTAMRADRLVEPARRINLAPRVMRALRRGLRHDPDARWPSLTALIAELEPRSRAAWVAAGAGAIGIAGAVALTIWATGDPPSPRAACRASAAAIEKVWPGRAAELDRAYPAELDHRLHGALDDYASRWRAMRLETCEADTVRGETGAEVATLQLRCLDDHRRILDELITQLVATPTPRGLDVVRLLPAHAACATTLLAVQPAPPTAALAEVSDLRVELARAIALRKLDELPAATAILDGVAARAEALGYGPLLAEVTAEQAELVWSTDPPRSRALLERATELATANRHDRVAAEAIKMQIVQAAQASDAHRFEALIPLGRAAAQRVGDPALEAEVAIAIGVALVTAGKHAEAETLCTDALAQLAPDRIQRLNGYSCLVQVALGRGDLAAAETAATDELALVEQLDGKDSIASVVPLDQLTLVRRRQMRSDDALALLDRSRAIIARVEGDRSRSMAMNDLQQVRILRVAKRLDEALAKAEHAIAIAGVVDRPPGTLTVGAQIQRADVLRAMQRPDDTKAAYEAALALGASALLPDDSTMIEARFNYASFLGESGQLDRASEIYDDLEQVLRRRGDPRLLTVRLAKAAIVEERQGCAAAVPLYEELIGELERSGANERNLVVSKSTLAECLWDANLDRKRARALMQEVHTKALAAGKAAGPLAANAERWLADHR